MQEKEQTLQTLCSIINAQVLLEEAIQQGLHFSDPVVIKRMSKNRISSGALLDKAAARKLNGSFQTSLNTDMFDSDPGIRKRLITLMRQKIQRESSVIVPSDTMLKSFIKEFAPEYAQVKRWQFVQVYFNPLEHGDSLYETMDIVKKRLCTVDTDKLALDQIGDPHTLPRFTCMATAAEIAEVFGLQFADGVALLPKGTWSGPVRSSHGWHLVQMLDYETTALKGFKRVKHQARLAWQKWHEAEYLKQKLGSLRKKYRMECPTLTADTCCQFPQSRMHFANDCC